MIKKNAKIYLLERYVECILKLDVALIGLFGVLTEFLVDRSMCLSLWCYYNKIENERNGRLCKDSLIRRV